MPLEGNVTIVTAVRSGSVAGSQCALPNTVAAVFLAAVLEEEDALAARAIEQGGGGLPSPRTDVTEPSDLDALVASSASHE